MRILVFEPMKEPYVKEIEDDIHAMQSVVGGCIEPSLSSRSLYLMRKCPKILKNPKNQNLQCHKERIKGDANENFSKYQQTGGQA